MSKSQIYLSHNFFCIHAVADKWMQHISLQILHYFRIWHFKWRKQMKQKIVFVLQLDSFEQARTSILTFLYCIVTFLSISISSLYSKRLCIVCIRTQEDIWAVQTQKNMDFSWGEYPKEWPSTDLSCPFSLFPMWSMSVINI